MKRRSYSRPILFALLILSMLIWPSLLVEKVRMRCVVWMTPLWRSLASKPPAEQQRLEAENHLLRLQVLKLHQACEQLGYHRDSLQGIHAICAHVIYRDPLQWMNTCWIDVGEETNRHAGNRVVSKHSPVLVGNALVGMIDYVGEKQSRIRLITDIALKPSVRVVRGSLQDVIFKEQLAIVLTHLATLPDSKEKQAALCFLQHLQQKTSTPNIYLAKGILQGAGVPLWRGRGHLLRGIGFNDDVANKGEVAPQTACLMVHDVLVTSGMDGIFPMGLPVAEVTRVLPMREGAYVYELEATPFVKNIDSLETVCIIPARDEKNDPTFLNKLP